MVYITFLSINDLIIDIGEADFLLRSFILGLITFVVFFLILKTMERHYTRKQIVSVIEYKWEKLLYGDTILLVKDGVLRLDKLNAARITSQQVFDAIKKKDLYHVSNIKRLYINPDNEFTLRAYNAAPVTFCLRNNDTAEALKETN
jgi:uncharacterized membrane protein YcaP (DUF421 family)